jgi:16S rRNA (guanine527-N7)-methyltransferase
MQFTQIQQEKLQIYHDLLVKWQNKINLISKHDVPHIWKRHIEDSAQLTKFFSEVTEDNKKILVDLGSGAGFPGMVLAILTNLEVHLIESDKKKCSFLKTVSREIGQAVFIHSERIEFLTNSIKADFISARALASLEKLIKLSFPFEKKETTCIFPKGKSFCHEIPEFEKALSKMKLKAQYEFHNSATNPEAKIMVARING